MITVRRFEPDADRPQLSALFRSFEAKSYQQRVQGIDPARLAEFLAERAVKEAASNLLWVAESRIADHESRLVGLAGLQKKHWHSEHTGFPVGKVTQLMTAPGAEDALAPLIDEIEKAAREHGLRHLAGRVDGHAFRAQEILCARGWYPVGTSVKLAVSLSRSSIPDPRSPPLEVRPHRPEDRARILAISGSESHGENHLFFDPHLPLDATHAIFRRWVEKCLDGLAAQVWVGEMDGEPIGFVTILDPKALNAALGTKIAVLDFIVLDDRVQGRGLGSQLLLAAHERVAAAGFDQIELRTTATNYPAINLYTKHGYKLVGTDQAFARWLG